MTAPTLTRRQAQRGQAAAENVTARARLPLVGTAALAVAVAGWGFARVLGAEASLLPVALGAAGPAVLLAVACAVRPGRGTAPASVTLPLSLLVLGVGGPLVASAVAPGPGPVEALRAFGGTWRTLLLSTLPAVADSAAVLAVLVVIWVAGALAAEAALRSPLVVLSLVPAVVVLAVAVALGLPAAGSPLPLAAALAGVGAAHLALSRVVPAPGTGVPAVPRPPDPVSTALRATTVLLVGSVAAAVGVVAGPRLPFAGERPPFDPRVLVELERDTTSGVSPLSRVSQWLAAPPSPLFAVSPGLAPTEHLRQVSLDTYDGSAWATSETYVVAGTRLPPSGTDAPTRSLSTRVGLGALPGPWLPAPARATSVEGVVVKVAPETGDLVTAGEPLPGSVYDVTSAVPDIDPAVLVAAGAGSDPRLDRLRELPAGLPAPIGETAETATGAGTTPVEPVPLEGAAERDP
ncbi:MAG TPA: transglutaminaseTgpA domain-containing protein, partial [Actinomycetales bacterium]|nr:transglutaminaseTgpA domain-containing protein [Actinomycetales bacterium]